MLPPFSHVQQQMPSQQMQPQQMQQTQSHQMQLQQMQQTHYQQMQPQQMQQTQYQQMQPQQMCQQQIHPQPMQQHPLFTAYPQQPQMALHLTQTDPSLPQYPQHTVAPMTSYPVSNPQFYRDNRPYQIPRPRKQPSFQGINASPQATPLPEPYKTRKILMAEIELLLTDKRRMQEELDAIVKQRDVLLEEKISHAAEKLDFERRLRDKEDNSAEQHGMQQQINLVVQERDVLTSQKLTLLAEKTEMEKQLRSKEDKLDEYRHTVAEQAADLRKLTMQIVDLISSCGKNPEDDDSISNKSPENDED